MKKSYRFKCRSSKCGLEFLRHYPSEEFDKLQYGGVRPGIGCFVCGFPKMAVMRSQKSVKDGFEPGFQRSIGKHCSTYAEYKAHLKAMGLVEMGYEDMPPHEPDKPVYFSDKKIRELNQRYGLGLNESDVKEYRSMVDKD
jgi:hypothetical protein